MKKLLLLLITLSLTITLVACGGDDGNQDGKITIWAWDPNFNIDIMNRAKDIYGGDGDEAEANAFAGLVLVPNTFLRQIDDRSRPEDVSEYDAWLETYRRAWGVSGEVILRRLMNARRLPNTKYSEYRRWREDFSETYTDGGSRKYRHREPKHVFGDTFVRTVLDARSARQISLAKATKYLDGLKLNDFHSLERYYESV